MGTTKVFGPRNLETILLNPSSASPEDIAVALQATIVDEAPRGNGVPGGASTAVQTNNGNGGFGGDNNFIYTGTHIVAGVPILANAGLAISAALDANGQQINNLDDPTHAQDAATRNYVDNAVAGVSGGGGGGAPTGAAGGDLGGVYPNPSVNQVGGANAALIAAITNEVANANTGNVPSTIMVRDSNGRAQVNDPAAMQDIASKNYVDLAIAGLPTPSTPLQATTHFNSADLGLLTNAPGLTLVSAAGLQANQALVPLAIEFTMAPSSTAYATTANVFLNWPGNYTGSPLWPVGNTSNNSSVGLLTSNTRTTYRYIQCVFNDYPIVVQSDINLQADGPITGGDGELVIRITYQIVTLPS